MMFAVAVEDAPACGEIGPARPAHALVLDWKAAANEPKGSTGLIFALLLARSGVF